ncbi:MAG: hypothetical protein EBR23_14730 [Planctomycetia bacterium]|nr:hypothetical protein [Planctomycetia bacterium]
MRFSYGLILSLLLCGAASAETTIVARRPVIVTAQDHALVLARRGTLVHSSCGQTEGIGCGATAEQARRNCCYFGKRQIVEEGVAYSPVTRRWFAVIRYR